jgi:ribonuclease D
MTFDISCLVPLYLDLQRTLEERGRLRWQMEEARELEDPNLYRADPADAWRRLKGLDRLRPEQRATLKLLAQWREARAIRKDKPRGWILTDESMREIADRLPRTNEQLESIEGLSANFLRKRSEEMLELIAQGRANASSEAPALAPNSSFSRGARTISYRDGDEKSSASGWSSLRPPPPDSSFTSFAQAFSRRPS